LQPDKRRSCRRFPRILSQGHTLEVTNANEKQSPHRLEVICPPFGAYWRRPFLP